MTFTMKKNGLTIEQLYRYDIWNVFIGEKFLTMDDEEIRTNNTR